jgi:hypothetical protein
MFVESQKENKLGKEALLDAILAKPTEAEARRNTYEETLTEPQLSELFTLIQIGRSLVSPLEMSSNEAASAKRIFDKVSVLSRSPAGLARARDISIHPETGVPVANLGTSLVHILSQANRTCL